MQSTSPSRLNSKLDAKLIAYMAAAGAAGVSLLALVPDSEAKIVYTPANTAVQFGTTIDLNNDGTADFVFTEFNMYHSQRLTVSPAVVGNAIRIGGQGAACGFFGVPVGPGERFGSNTSYFQKGVFLAGFFQYSHTSYHGPWSNVVNRYLGLKFLINGQVHFGWARLTVPRGLVGAVMTGYAYETTPNVNILEGHTSGASATNFLPSDLFAPSPQPPTLGMLARGADGFALWRREEDALTN